MSEKHLVRELLADQYPAKKVANIEAIQFQLAQKSDLVTGKSVANGLFIGNLGIVQTGSAYAGTLTLAINNSVSTENIERVVKESQASLEMKGITFDALTPTYAGADAAGTKICSLIFTGYKVTFI